MSLTQIDLRPVYKHKYQAQFSPEAWCIPELYWSFLKNYNIKKVKKINIIVSDNWGDKVFDFGTVVGFKEINMPFDFEKYFSLDVIGRKRMQLEVVNDGMMRLAEKENWEINPLLDAYNGCLEKDLKYEFLVSEKHKASPNRKYYINFLCEWDLDYCKLYWILYDKQKKEIVRNLIVEKEAFLGEFVYYIKYKWVDNENIVLENKHRCNEVFDININKYLRLM